MTHVNDLAGVQHDSDPIIQVLARKSRTKQSTSKNFDKAVSSESIIEQAFDQSVFKTVKPNGA